ncbi:hypothetical protein HMPREF2999_00250 [Rothia sp. HMSC066H02]|uniref:hypothetical protein n=1 Tax=unclassified Rothia (in: high G+C Gram-positive bacteria) TaxID=2689056 RepID=UPI0008A550E8|nr:MULTISPECIES: hypothetical protein [unclassified Rothia (in: high G+C Gram-positive bacteria)]OFO95763.1 hypothetical protein HMPREF3008_00620 [Rothia sp. HMSC065D09]OFP14704.1 hypothetical protein HMPREF2999_00250 [Rothia sp. HMSC066H02]
MDFKTLSPAYLTSLGVIFCGALLIGTSNPWLLWLGWILLILALGLNVLAFVLSVGKAKGDPTPALVANLDGIESSVENRIRERSEHRREEREAAEHEAVEHDAAAQADQEVAPAEAVEATEPAETAEVREEEPTESQPIVDRAPGRMSVLPSRPRSGRTPKPRSNAR